MDIKNYKCSSCNKYKDKVNFISLRSENTITKKCITCRSYTNKSKNKKNTKVYNLHE